MSRVAQFFSLVIERINRGNLAMQAAALTYYSLFSLGPIILIAAGWIAVLLRNSPEFAEQVQVTLVTLGEQLIPAEIDIENIVEQAVELVFMDLQGASTIGIIATFAVLFWSASNFFNSLLTALERILVGEVQRGIIAKRLLAGATVLAVGVFIVFELLGSALLSNAVLSLREAWQWVGDTFGLETADPHWLSGPNIMPVARFVVAWLVFSAAFRFLSGGKTRWRFALLGGGFSIATITMMREVLPKLVTFERFNVVYGVVTAMLTVLLWLYLALFLFLLGAAISSALTALLEEEPEEELVDKFLQTIFHPAWFMPFATFMVRWYVRIVYGLKATGQENVPKTGPAIVAANHVTAWDPPIVGVVCPRRLEFMAKKELFNGPFFSAIMYGVRTFPVDRQANDIGAIREAVKRLRNGRVVGIFIEGTRTGGRMDVQALDGAGFIARSTQAPVVPTAVWREGRKYRVHFGKPIEIGKVSRAELSAWTAALKDEIYGLIPSEGKLPER